MLKKNSWFNKLTGSIEVENNFESNFKPLPEYDISNEYKETPETETEGELGIDVYETDKTFIIRCMVAGVSDDNIDISLSRKSVTIRGSRTASENIHDDDYHYRELYWGTFSRSIDLPGEINIDSAQAQKENGMLTLTLLKTDPHRQTTLKLKKE